MRTNSTSRAAADLRWRLSQVGAAATLSAPSEHTHLLQQIVATAMHVTGARAGSLYLVDRAANELIFEVALGERAAPLVGRRMPVGQGIAGWVAATGQPMAIADVGSDERWSRQLGEAVGYAPRAMVALPLWLRDEVVGVLQLLDRADGDPFDAEDMETLGRFAQLAGVAISQSASVRHLSALIPRLMGEHQDDLAPEVIAFLDQTEQSEEYAELLELAQGLGDIAQQPAGRRLGRDLVRAIAAYVKDRPTSPR